MIWKNDSSLQVGFFLAVRDIKRSNRWTTFLIITVMTLTFFNMLFVGSILVGLASGLIGSFRDDYSSDIFITPSVKKTTIQDTDAIMTVVKSLPTLQSFSKRYTADTTVEYGYRNKTRASDKPESVGAVLVGIDPQAEDSVINIASHMKEGTYLDPGDVDSVLIGKDLLSRYVKEFQTISKKLKSVAVGSRVRLTVGDKQREVTVKGIVGTGNQIADTRVYMVDSAARELLGKSTLEASEIAVKLKLGASDSEAKKYIIANLPPNNQVVVQKADEAVPGGSIDVRDTFALLGDMIGTVAVIVSSITIFIVIFVNAITRRKFIGILKGIGISSKAIEISYVFQAVFYALAGIIIGSVLMMGFLKPYFDIHPLQLPVAEGHLDISVNEMLIKSAILLVAAVVSGFIPARLVTRQNTLDAILGR